MTRTPQQRSPARASASARRAFVLAAVLTLVAPAAHAAPVFVPGGGSATTDCFAAWTFDLPEAPKERDVRKARISCEDGAASCDADGVVDGRCTFRVQLCFGTSGQPARCTPKPLGIYDLRRPSSRAARKNATAAANRAAILDAVGELHPPIFPGSCTGDALIQVPLRKKARRSQQLLRGRVRAADGRRSDKDALRLVCKRARSTGGSQTARAFVLTSDFANVGSYSTVTVDRPHRIRKDLGQTHSDAIGRVFGDRVYVVNRLGQDNIQVVNPASGATVSACSIGNGSNPQDIAFVDQNKAYVTRFQDGFISIVDPTVPPTCQGFKRGRIDLSGFADADGSPELGRMVIVGTRLYVAVLRLDRDRRFVPAARGLVAVVDTTTDTVIDVDPDTPELDAVRLVAGNPFGMAYDAASDRVWVWESGDFFVTGDGGIEAIDPTTNRLDRLIATEEGLGGSITVVAPYSRDRAFAVVADDQFNNSLVAFSPATGARLERLHRAAGFFPDVAVDGHGSVWLADRTLRRPGVRIFDAKSGAPVAGPLDLGLPPFNILFLP